MANCSYTAMLTKKQLADMFTGTVLSAKTFTDAVNLLKRNDGTYTTVTGRIKYHGFDVGLEDYCKQDYIIDSNEMHRRVRASLIRAHEERKEKERRIAEEVKERITVMNAVMACIERGIRAYDNKEKNNV